MGPFQVVFIDLVIGEAREQLLESDAAFLTRQRLPNAEMMTLSKMNGAIELSVDIELIRVLELTFVSMRCSGQEQNSNIRRNGDAVAGPFFGGPASLDLRWRVDPQEFLDCIIDNVGV